MGRSSRNRPSGHFTRPFETFELEHRSRAKVLLGMVPGSNTVAADSLFLFDQDDLLAGLGP